MSRLQAALAAARDTKALELGRGAIVRTRDVFRKVFGERDAIVIADSNTLPAAARVIDQLRCAKFVFEDQELYAEHEYVEQLQQALAPLDAIPIAVGAGTINDLTKLAAHRAGRPYMCVATAASMDGYTAYGSSITYRGSKQTFDCPAPRAVIADIDVIEAAPAHLTAAGYADLLAKIPAGADWIIADALDIEPIAASVWETVQGGLREAVAHPIDIARLTDGLMMSGFAMQAHLTSRPASGAEHQFSHLWDMQHHTHEGEPVSHGFKVGVATLAVTRFYESLLDQPIELLSIDAAVMRWPTWEQTQRSIHTLFDIAELRDKALLETRAKWTDREQLRAQLTRLRERWPALKGKLRKHLLPAAEIERRLQFAGAPTMPQHIGISPQRLRDSFRLAYHIRRRFTVLDLAERAGLLEQCLP